MARHRLPHRGERFLSQDRVIGGLSVREFALLHRQEVRPLGQVLGASVVRTARQYLPALDPSLAMVSMGPYGGYGIAAGTTLGNRFGDASPRQVWTYQWHTEVVCSLDVLSDAWNNARRQALDRLTDEAVQLDADAVVGVRFQTGENDLGRGTVDVVVTGTAVRLPGPRPRTSLAPLLSDVSVQDYWRLRRSGYEAAGLLAASAVVFASPARTTRWRRTRGRARNQELGELSSAFALARETLRTSLHSQAYSAHGEGVVGVSFQHSVASEKLSLASSLGSASDRGWKRGGLGIPYYVSGRGEAERRGWMITMHATGTAIRRSPGAEHPSAPAPEAQIWLGGR